METGRVWPVGAGLFAFPLGFIVVIIVLSSVAIYKIALHYSEAIWQITLRFWRQFSKLRYIFRRQFGKLRYGFGGDLANRVTVSEAIWQIALRFMVGV
jgi:hypothetical protein